MADESLQRSRMLARAKSAVLSRDYSVAQKIYRDLLLQNPSDIEVMNCLGSLFVKSGQDDDAIIIYNQVLNVDPNNVQALNELGAAYRRLKEYDRSVEYLQRAVIADETDSQSFYNLGFTYKLIGKSDSAIKAFERVLDNNPNDVLAYNHIGTILAAKGEYDKALEFYHRGLSIDSNHPVLHLNIAKVYDAQGKADCADMEYRTALRIKPLWKDSSIAYADFLTASEKYSDALSILDSISNIKDCEPLVQSRRHKLEELIEKLPVEDNLQHYDESVPSQVILPTTEVESDNSSAEVQVEIEPDESISQTETVADEVSFEEDNIVSLGEISETADAEVESQSVTDLAFEDDDSILKEYKSDPSLSIERLSEDNTDIKDLFEEKLSDVIEADNQVPEDDVCDDAESLNVSDEDYVIEESDETEEITGSEKYNDHVQEIYLETEDEIIGKDNIEPATVTQKPSNPVEDTCSGPLLSVHVSDREQAYEERLAQTDPRINDTVDKAISAASDSATAEKFRDEVMMFQELEELSQSLPKDERDYFNESKSNLQLEYIISKLSGKPGLLATSEEVRKMLEIEDSEEIDSTSDMKMNVLAFKVLSQCRTLIKSLPDKGIAVALDEQVKHVLSRLY